MRAVVQRVREARVEVEGEVTGSIELGLLVLLGIDREDTTTDADYLAAKIAGLRVFTDDAGKMNLSVKEIGGAILVVSQFTLYGDTRKGRRPSYDRAANPELAKRLYEYFVFKCRELNLPVQTGLFQASMSVYLINDGPVTLICDSSGIVSK
jgi:D-tyrosyl-tRNA(Tyr) deacylase